MLIAHDIHKSYGDVNVLKGVSLTVQSGQLSTLLGTSGAGKTTLLQILGLLEEADSGEVYFDNQPLHNLGDNAKAHFRSRQLGYVFQFHHLLPEFTATENVCMPAFIRGERGSRVETRARQLLESLNLGHRLTHKPGQLSGGEQQRVAVARALMNEPRLILADEPTGNLDSQNGKALFELFHQLAHEHQVAFLVATHNEEFAAASDACYRIVDGRLAALQDQPQSLPA